MRGELPKPGDTVGVLVDRWVRGHERPCQRRDRIRSTLHRSKQRLARILLLLANFGREGPAGANHSENQPRDTGGNDQAVDQLAAYETRRIAANIAKLPDLLRR
jgi:hypothetical protein